MTTLYEVQEDGGIEFASERRAWGVDIPAYVYDLWMPLLGSDIIGMLGVYYRLERDSEVKGLSLKKLAVKCCKSSNTLAAFNEILEDCGFIRIIRPIGDEITRHFTLRIVTLDPPGSVSNDVIEKYAPKDKEGDIRKDWKYEPLTPWLVAVSHIRDTGGSDMRHDEAHIRDTKIDPSYVDPSLSSEGLQQKDAANASQPNAVKNNRLANVPTKAVQGAVEGKESIVLYTALERKILQATKATKLTDAQRDQLDKSRTYTVSQGTSFVDQTTAAANDLYESNEEFRKFADERIRYLKDVAHLSAGKMIDNLCDYDSKTGWFYHQSLSKPQSLPEEVRNVPRQPIAGGMIKGTKTVKDIYGEDWNEKAD